MVLNPASCTLKFAMASASFNVGGIAVAIAKSSQASSGAVTMKGLKPYIRSDLWQNTSA
jgi:hypothetical protein